MRAAIKPNPKLYAGEGEDGWLALPNQNRGKRISSPYQGRKVPYSEMTCHTCTLCSRGLFFMRDLRIKVYVI